MKGMFVLPSFWVVLLPLLSVVVTLAVASTITIPLHLARGTLSNLQAVVSESPTHDSRQTYNLRGRPGQGYYITVSMGTPEQMLNVLIDTGSSNFAIGSVPDPLIDKYFHIDRSSTFQHRNVNIVVPYTMGSWNGFLGSDIVKLQGLPAVRTDIACITHADHFFINGSEWQGILGLGFPAIARPSDIAMPLFDNLVSSHLVSDVFSLQLCGKQDEGSDAGSLILGGVDRRFHTDHIRYTPLRRAWYYEVILTGLRVGRQSLSIDCKELNNDKTIVDSGTTNLRLPKSVFSLLIKELNDQVQLDEPIPKEFWEGGTFMCWAGDSVPLKNFPELRLSLAHSPNSTFTLVITPKQYLRPVTDVEKELENHTCYKFAVNPSDTGTVIGAVIMEGFYVVFDRQNRRVGFAKSACSPHDSSGLGPEIEGPFPHPDPWSCVYKVVPNQTLQLVSYAMAALATLFALPLLVMLGQWIHQKWTQKNKNRLIDYNSDVDE